MFDNHDKHTLYNDAWDECGGRFAILRLFVGDLAVAFANTASVECDFSTLTFEFNANRIALGDLSIGGTVHAKQHVYLMKLQAPAMLA